MRRWSQRGLQAPAATESCGGGRPGRRLTCGGREGGKERGRGAGAHRRAGAEPSALLPAAAAAALDCSGEDKEGGGAAVNRVRGGRTECERRRREREGGRRGRREGGKESAIRRSVPTLTLSAAVTPQLCPFFAWTCLEKVGSLPPSRLYSSSPFFFFFFFFFFHSPSIFPPPLVQV